MLILMTGRKSSKLLFLRSRRKITCPLLLLYVYPSVPKAGKEGKEMGRNWNLRSCPIYCVHLQCRKDSLNMLTDLPFLRKARLNLFLSVLSTSFMSNNWRSRLGLNLQLYSRFSPQLCSEVG